MINPIVFLFFIIMLTGFGQILLKLGARHGKEKERFIASYFNLSTFTAYGFFFVVTILSIYVLEEIPLKLYVAIMSLNVFAVAGFSRIFLGESISKQHLSGLILIVAGLILFNMM